MFARGRLLPLLLFYFPSCQKKLQLECLNKRKVLILITQTISHQVDFTDFSWITSKYVRVNVFRIRPRILMTSHFFRNDMCFFLWLAQAHGELGDRSHFKIIQLWWRKFTNSSSSFHLCLLPSLSAKMLPAYVKAAVSCIHNSIFIIHFNTNETATTNGNSQSSKQANDKHA